MRLQINGDLRELGDLGHHLLERVRSVDHHERGRGESRRLFRSSAFRELPLRNFEVVDFEGVGVAEALVAVGVEFRQDGQRLERVRLLFQSVKMKEHFLPYTERLKKILNGN